MNVFNQINHKGERMNIQNIMSVHITVPTLFEEQELKSYVEGLIKLEFELLAAVIERTKREAPKPQYQVMNPSSVKLMGRKLGR